MKKVFLKYLPKKKVAKFEYSLIGFMAFAAGAVFSFLPMAFDTRLWWLPLMLMSLGLRVLGSISILIGGIKE